MNWWIGYYLLFLFCFYFFFFLRLTMEFWLSMEFSEVWITHLEASREGSYLGRSSHFREILRYTDNSNYRVHWYMLRWNDNRYTHYHIHWYLREKFAIILTFEKEKVHLTRNACRDEILNSIDANARMDRLLNITFGVFLSWSPTMGPPLLYGGVKCLFSSTRKFGIKGTDNGQITADHYHPFIKNRQLILRFPINKALVVG